MFEADENNESKLPVTSQIQNFLVENQKLIIAAGVVLVAIFLLNDSDESEVSLKIKKRPKVGK